MKTMFVQLFKNSIQKKDKKINKTQENKTNKSPNTTSSLKMLKISYIFREFDYKIQERSTTQQKKTTPSLTKGPIVTKLTKLAQNSSLKLKDSYVR